MLVESDRGKAQNIGVSTRLGHHSKRLVFSGWRNSHVKAATYKLEIWSGETLPKESKVRNKYIAKQPGYVPDYILLFSFLILSHYFSL